MARKESDLKTCMITQELDKKFYKSWYEGAAPEEIARLDAIFAAAENEDATPLTIEICRRLGVAGIEAQEAYGVIHKRDTRQVWDEANNEYITELKTPHFHDVIKFSKGGTLTAIASAISFEPQFIEKPQRGRYAYDNMLSYLIHIKDDVKYPYSPSSVCAVCPEGSTVKEYKDIYAERKRDWEMGRAKKTTERTKTSIDWLESEIIAGRITKRQIVLTDEYFDIYARNKRRCDDAFDVYAERKVYKTLSEIEQGNIKIVTVFIQGESGSGKTTFAKALANNIAKDAASEGLGSWHIYDAAATNGADDYSGEEIYLMDDIRGLSMTASDWLRLMDENNISRISARYRNKMVASRVFIITSSVDPFTFFSRLKDDTHDGEAMSQFIRRITANIKVYRMPNEQRRFTIEESHRVPRFNPFAGRVLTGRIESDYDFDLLSSDNEDLTAGEAIEKISTAVMSANKLEGANKNPILVDDSL